MEAKEIRLRCIEATTRSGVTDVPTVLQRARDLETWVNAVEDKATPLKRGPKPKSG